VTLPFAPGRRRAGRLRHRRHHHPRLAGRVPHGIRDRGPETASC
jgi:hypothetical protein